MKKYIICGFILGFGLEHIFCSLQLDSRTILFYLWTKWVPVEALGALVLEHPAVQRDEDLPEKCIPFQGS